jgi:hypothetical protein
MKPSAQQQERIVKIKAIARHNGMFITLLGFIALLLIAFLSSYFWQQARLPLMFLLLASCVAIFIGLLKLAEPQHSLILSSDNICFYHRHGNWQLQWHQLQNVHGVTNTVGVSREELNYVGIKLFSLDVLVDNISLRLANRLIHEQKPLIQYAVKHNLITFQQGIINFEPFQLTSGETVKGPLAAFLHHSLILHQAFGAHIFIAANNLNGPVNNFVVLANNYLRNTKETPYIN